MVLTPTERNIIRIRKHNRRTHALKHEIGGLLLRIERILEKCITELEVESQDIEKGAVASVTG